MIEVMGNEEGEEASLERKPRDTSQIIASSLAGRRQMQRFNDSTANQYPWRDVRREGITCTEKKPALIQLLRDAVVVCL